MNPGVTTKLLNEGLVELVMMPSPFKTHAGRDIDHMRITAAGRRALAGIDQQSSARPQHDAD